MFLLSLLYLILTIIRPQDYMAALAGIPLLSVTLGMAAFCWLISSAKTFAAPQFLILPAFLMTLMLSEVFNHWTGGALEQLSSFGPTMIIFFVLAAAIAHSRNRVPVTFAVIALCSMVLALHSVDQKQYGVGWTGMGMIEDGRVQYVGIFNDPNDLGLLFVTALPMTVFLSAGGGFLRRIFWLAGAALLLYGIYLTNSRGALLAVLVVGGIYIWYRRGMMTAGALSVVGLIVMQMLSSRMSELDSDEESANGRVDAWYEGLHMFLSQPVFGVGAGNFTDYNYLTAHNSFVLVLAETGIVGFTLWLAFVGYGFWMMVAVLRHKPALTAGDDEQATEWAMEKRLAMTLLLSLFGMFAAAFFLSRSYIVLIYLEAALVVGYYIGARRRYPGLPSLSLSDSWWRWIPISIGSVVLLFIIVTLLLHTS
ncbi:O-antigen ligase family protein [Rhodanobacter sp. L36]|uniref:O-antigen ligase family protein n=1 Tax=Rhodanobacter sp. L36 TaxID=1747221 RepID=UPI00131C0299|nr:O-antigen ligase family protein [Rhodanobacter sp. L36]